MSPSGRLCLLVIAGLILPTRGQTLKEAASISTVDLNTVSTRILAQVPDEERGTDTAHLEVQPTLQTWTGPADETTQSQTERETETQQPTGTDAFLVTDPGTHRSNKEGITVLPERRSPSKDIWMDPETPKPSGSNEDNPFYYDYPTLRRRGLLVAAVLFITGIIILTSGKCRQLSRLCQNRHRAYRVVKTRGRLQEAEDRGDQTCG